MSAQDIITTVSILVNLIFGYFTFNGARRRSEYDFIDGQIADILKIQMEHPDYRRDGYEPSDETGKLRFDAYRCLVWNSLETMYEKYGERRLRNSSFFPALQILAQRHKAWLDIDGSGYGVKFKRFLIA